MEPDDEALVAQAVAGSRDALELLIGRYERLVYRVVRRMVGRTEDARDVAQTVFLKAFENLRGFDSRYRFRSWITRIAINESLNHRQRRKGAEALNEAWPDDRRGPLDQLRGAELSQAVDRALGQMPADHRAVIVLRYFLELSYGEMASILEIPEKTVKSRLFSSRQRLKDALVSMGIVGA